LTEDGQPDTFVLSVRSSVPGKGMEPCSNRLMCILIWSSNTHTHRDLGLGAVVVHHER